MRRTAFMLAVILAVGMAMGVIGDRVLNAQQQPVTRTVLLKTDLAGIEGKEGLVVLAEIAPGAASGKHAHLGHEFAYVLEGAGILEVEGQPPVPLKPGMSFHLAPKQVHNGKNASQTAPLKTLVFYIAEKGQPLTAPVK